MPYLIGVAEVGFYEASHLLPAKFLSPQKAPLARDKLLLVLSQLAVLARRQGNFMELAVLGKVFGHLIDTFLAKLPEPVGNVDQVHINHTRFVSHWNPHYSTPVDQFSQFLTGTLVHGQTIWIISVPSSYPLSPAEAHRLFSRGQRNMQ